MITVWLDSVAADREADILTPTIGDTLRCFTPQFDDDGIIEDEWLTDYEQLKEVRQQQVGTLTDAIVRARAAEAKVEWLARRVRELEGTKRFLEDQLVAMGHYQ